MSPKAQPLLLLVLLGATAAAAAAPGKGNPKERTGVSIDLDRIDADDCTDKHENCASWSMAGQCRKNPVYMREFCYHACCGAWGEMDKCDVCMMSGAEKEKRINERWHNAVAAGDLPWLQVLKKKLGRCNEALHPLVSHSGAHRAAFSNFATLLDWLLTECGEDPNHEDGEG